MCERELRIVIACSILVLRKCCFMTINLIILSALSVSTAQTLAAVDYPPNLYQTEPWLYRGGRPGPESLTSLKALGVTTIVNLEREWFRREPSSVKEERRLAQEYGMQFIHIPLHPFFRPSAEDITTIMSILSNTSLRPIFIHCRRGSDRTGIAIAIFRVRHQGWTVKNAYVEMDSLGFRNIILFWWKGLISG